VRSLAILWSLFFAAAVCPAQIAPPSAPPEKLEAGKLIERVVTAANPEQSYALYLPSNYSPDRSWPVVFAFDPGAQGKIPVDQMKDAAERYGYIVLGSNNSRNGPWKPESEAADAMLQDAQKRFAVDLKRIYFAGFSGGARVASQLAQLCKCAAGVLLSGAGFSQHSQPLRETSFPVFSAVGLLDFNYSEVIPLQDKLEKAGYPHWLCAFNGQHQWAPPEVMDEALAWFRIQAMRNNREPPDEAFVTAKLKEMVSIAEKQDASGVSLSAWRLYKQIASAYEGVADVARFKVKAEELARTKAVQDALKRERNDFADQESLSSQILGTLQTKENIERPRSEGGANATQQVHELRLRSETEKETDKAIVLKRALAGVFVGAIEAGNDVLDKKDYRNASRYFSIAAEGRPDAEWPLRQLAIAQALDKDRKASMETLKRVKAKANNAEEFMHWLQTEPAFQELRTHAEFGELGIKN